MRKMINDRYIGRIRCRTDWEEYKLVAMIRALLCRISYTSDDQTLIPNAANIGSVRNELLDPPFVRALLERPVNALFVEHTRNDRVWGDGGDNGIGCDGTNYLGKILTALSVLLQGNNCSTNPLLKQLMSIKAAVAR